MIIWRLLRGIVHKVLDGVAWLTQDNKKISRVKDHRFQDYIRLRGLGKSDDSR
jgi:hypothetical protein